MAINFNIPKVDTGGQSKFSSLKPRKKKERDTFQKNVASDSLQSRIDKVVDTKAPMTSIPDTSNASATDPKTKFVQNVADATSQPTVSEPTIDKPITGTATTPSGAQVDVGTGALVSDRPDRSKVRYEDAYNEYIRSLTPTAQEKQARDYVNRLLTEGQASVDKAAQSGETLGFARGRSAQVANQANRQIEAAGRGLSALTGEREATSEAARLRAEFEQGQLPETPEPIKVGDSIVQLNPETGQYEEVFSAPSQAEGITLSPGQVRFERDPETGELRQVATGGVSPESVERQLEQEQASSSAKSQASRMVGSITSLLSDDLTNISGALRTAKTNREQANKMLNLKALLTIENLDKLKGAMSDRDIELIQQAGATLAPSIQESGTSNLPTDVLEQELKNLRGIFQLKAGQPVNIQVTDPGTGETRLFEDVDDTTVDDAYRQGFLIDFT